MSLRSHLSLLGRIAHATALLLVLAAAGAAVAATALSALGVIPWLTLEARFGEAAVPGFGMGLQVGLTVLLVLMAATIPSGSRMLALEKSHRDFRMTMRDVAEAYHHAHAGDRQGVFRLSSEFDQVRERIEYLRDHPDLKLLEADILTLAAQMSQQSHRLAEIYSDEKVARAKDFLQQRQAEAEEQQRRITEALGICREIGRWSSRVELEEATVASQLQALDEQLQAVLPALGYQLDGSEADRERLVEPAPLSHGVEVRRPANVVSMGARTAAE